MPPAQQEQLLRVIASFLAILPAGPLQARLDQVKEHLHETYFCWIGGFGESDSFYFRIQSPVILFEFDHHSGVFLTNKEPMKYHIHTLCRTPNGNDYGRELIQIYRKQNARNGH